MKSVITIILFVFISSVGNSQSVTCCDSLFKLFTSNKTTFKKKTTIKTNDKHDQDINITIDNSHSANNTLTGLPCYSNTPNPNGKEPGNIFDYVIRVITILSGIYLVYLQIYFGRKLEKVKLGYSTQLEEYKSKLSEELTIKIEPFKAFLQKENISYQISMAELTKIRLVKIEELVVSIIELQDYSSKNLTMVTSVEDFEKIKKRFSRLYDKVNHSRKVCELYLTDELIKKVIDVLNNIHSAYMSFVKMYRTNESKLRDTSMFNTIAQQINSQLMQEHLNALLKLDAEIDKFSFVLKDLTNEFKKQIIFKDLSDSKTA